MHTADSAVKKEKSPKPMFNLWQNAAYMIALAWKYCKQVLVLCLVLVFTVVGKRLLELFAAPVLLGKIEAGVPVSEMVIYILIFVGGLMLLNAFEGYARANTLFGRVYLREIIATRVEKKYMTTSYPNTIDEAVGKKLEKVQQSIGNNSEATEAIWSTLISVCQDILGLAVYLFIVSSLSPTVIAVTLVTAVSGYLVSKRINGWGYRHRDEEAEILKKWSYVGASGRKERLAKDIRIFGLESWLNDIAASAKRLYADFSRRREGVYLWADLLDAVLALLRNGIAYAYLVGLVVNGELTASQFLLYFAAFGGFTQWVTSVLGDFSTLHRQSLDISTVREFIQTPEPFKFEDGEPIEPDVNDKYEIELRNVWYQYPGAEDFTLKNINLRICAGEKLAIVGLNGAGKTTLIKLICGFLDPTKGEIQLNGRDIRAFNRRDYYRHFTAVFQEFSLLPTTVTDNIIQYAELDEQRMKSCIEFAGLTEKVDGLPDGVNTHYTREIYADNGVEFSGGEVQRLMLARALYKDAPILVLDEPTAALDPIAESDMYAKYARFSHGRTSLYISHRLASTRFCDRIVLIDGGEIIEEGNHDSLLKAGGKYAELFGVQSSYYAKGGAHDDETAEV